MVERGLEDFAFRQQFERARSAAMESNLTEPRAVSAFYDSGSGLVMIQLRSGAVFSFPAEIAQGLSGEASESLTQVEVTPMGDGLHWEILDVDFSVVGLLGGVFGSRDWMSGLQQRWAQQQAS